MEIDQAEFVLSLPGDWTQVEGSDDDQRCFESAALKSSLVMSVTHASVLASRLEATGRLAMQTRRHAEEELTPGVQFEEFGVKADETLAQVRFGSRNAETGLIARTLLLVTTRKIVTVWLGCETSSHEHANELMNTVSRALRVKIP